MTATFTNRSELRKATEQDARPTYRVLLVLTEPPLPFGGAMGRWFYALLRGLVERGHRVTAFVVCSVPAEIEETKRLFPGPDYDLRCYTHPARSGLLTKWETFLRPYSYVFGPQIRADLE